MTCPLCGGGSPLWASGRDRGYQRCQACGFIFVAPEFHLSTADEHAHYDLHENSDTDPRYHEYLSRIAARITPHLAPAEAGLDFGCGTSTLLGTLLSGDGRRVHAFDLFYRPDPLVWSRRYDFIVLSEVIEHLRDPLETLKRLTACLAPGGRIFVKTVYAPEALEDFLKWHYQRDPTHIGFFNPASMAKLAEKLGMRAVEELGGDLHLLAAHH